MLPLNRRISYWSSQATPDGPTLRRSTVSGLGASGIGRSLWPQVSRRAAVTTVAVVVMFGAPLAPGCVICTVQCWVERLVRTAVACTSNARASSAAAKLTVSAIGVPSTSGCCITDCSAMAAVAPPKGPTMFQ